MSRTGQQQATDAQKTYMDNSNKAFAQGQQGIAQYERNIGQLAKGGQVGADPWLSPTYLATQNKLTANATSGENDASAKVMRDTTLRAGGTNTNATNYATKALALNKMRLADTLNAQRTGQDFNRNVDYQRSLASAPLAEVSGESPYYGTSTSGEGQALGDLTQFGLASYGPWNSIIQGIGGAASAAIPLCPAEGTLILMADGSEKSVEKIVKGDQISGLKGESLLVTKIRPAKVPILGIRTSDDCMVVCSASHTLVAAGSDFVVAFESLGKRVRTKHGFGYVTSVELRGTGTVFDLQTDGTHSYRAGGVWALGVGDVPSDLYLKRAEIMQRLCEFEAIESELECVSR